MPKTTRRLTKTQGAVIDAARRLLEATRDYPGRAPIGTAEWILNPIDYAWAHHESYLRRFAPRRKGQVEAVFFGMNPGPWGMAQTGVPFGSPDVVESFLGIRGPVEAPTHVHPKRPILGWEGTRTEVSGRRLWGGIERCFGSAEAFFERFFVMNFCPLVFQSATGANVVPEKLPKDELAPCIEACKDHAAEALQAMGARKVIGIGKWAEKMIRQVSDERELGIEVVSILHPSPASPIANRGWLKAARKQLAELGHPWPEPSPE